MFGKKKEEIDKRKTCVHKRVKNHDKCSDGTNMVLNTRVICQDCGAWWDIDVTKRKIKK